jgi:hypothetical protein
VIRLSLAPLLKIADQNRLGCNEVKIRKAALADATKHVLLSRTDKKPLMATFDSLGDGREFMPVLS